MAAPEATKTMAVRVPAGLHARCSILAKVAKRSLSDVLIEAIESYVESRWSDPAVREHAQQALDQISREAASQREAIESLMQPGDAPETPTGSARKRGPKR